MHVQVDVDHRPVGHDAGGREVARAAVMPARRQLRVDLLELVGDPREGELRAQRGCLLAELGSSSGVRRKLREVRRERLRVPGRVLEPARAVARAVPHRPECCSRPARSRWPAPAPARRASASLRRSRARRTRASPAPPRCGADSASANLTRSASRCPSAAGVASGRDDHTVARQRASAGSRRRARRKRAQRGALLLGDEHESAACPCLPGPLARKTAAAAPARRGQHDAVVRREEPVHQRARGLVGGDARVEPAEQQLRELASELRRRAPARSGCGRCRRSAPARCAARRSRRSARTARARARCPAAGVVERLLDRARDVDRQ